MLGVKVESNVELRTGFLDSESRRVSDPAALENLYSFVKSSGEPGDRVPNGPPKLPKARRSNVVTVGSKRIGFDAVGAEATVWAAGRR